MASDHHSAEVFKEKRRPKTPIKFGITLNEEQKKQKQKFYFTTLQPLKAKPVQEKRY
jgi:hypothetical protein